MNYQKKLNLLDKYNKFYYQNQKPLVPDVDYDNLTVDLSNNFWDVYDCENSFVTPYWVYGEGSVNFNFSGIDGENNILITIDNGKPLIFEYNIHQKRVYYSFDNKLSIGDHSIYISAKDNVGNENITRGLFKVQ